MIYKIPQNWWESEGGFFNEIYLEGDNSLEGFLLSPLDLNERTKEEIEGVIRLSELQQGSKVLDCPSGYGRHSIALGSKGFEVVGADVNDYFLGIARENLKKVGLRNVNFIKNDMRVLEFSNEFDAAINMFYSFGFFNSDEENIEALRNFYKALKPGGKWLMHTHVTAPRFQKDLIKLHEIRTLKTGNRLELFREYNESTKREDGQWTLLNGHGKKVSTPYSMRIYTDNEYRKICSDIGFSKVDVYGDWKGSEYKEESELMIVVATK